MEKLESVEKKATPKTTAKAKTTSTTKVAEKKEAPATKTVKKPTVKAEKVEKVEKVEKAPKVEKAVVTETPKKSTAKKTTKAKVSEFLGTGKRKSSVARVRLTVGTGKIVVNDKDLQDYFKLDTLIFIVKQPLVLTSLENQVEITANIYGGGFTGQAGALRQGITRALLEYNPQLRADLKKAGFITRDSRIKERKKYGLKKARKASQFSKR